MTQLDDSKNTDELDEILRRIAYWNGYDSPTEWERTGSEAKSQLTKYIEQQVLIGRIDECLWFQDRTVQEDTLDDIKESVAERLTTLKAQLKDGQQDEVKS